MTSSFCILNFFVFVTSIALSKLSLMPYPNGMVRFFDLLLSLNETFVVLTLSLLSGTCLIWTSISSLDGNLVNLALSSLNMTCLVLDHCGVDLTLLSFLDACLIYTYWMGWCECGLGRHFFYTSTPFGRNRMNLVSQELVLFRFALKSLIVKELKRSVQKVSSLKSNTLHFGVGGGLIFVLLLYLFTKVRKWPSWYTIGAISLGCWHSKSVGLVFR